MAQGVPVGPPSQTEQLGKRELTTIHAVGQSLSLGPMLGVALILAGISAPSAGNFTGPLSVAVATVGVLGLGYAISLFARRYAGAGTVHEYLTRGGNPRWGVLGSLLYFAGLFWITAGVYAGVGVLMSAFAINHLGIDVSWSVCTLVLVAAVQAVNYLGVRLATRVMLAVAASGFVSMLFLAAVVIAKGGHGGNTLAVFNPSTTSISHVLDGLLLAVTLFVGFEVAAAIGEESKEPHKTIPRALLWTVLITGSFLTVMTYTLAIAYGQKAVNAGVWLADPNYLDTVATHYVGSWLATILDLVVLFDGFAVSLGICVAAGHGLYALAREGLISPVFRKTTRFGTPLRGNLVNGVSGVVIVILALAIHYGKTFGTTDPFAWYFVASTAGTYLVLLLYLTLVLLAFRFVRLTPSSGRWWRYIVVLIGLLLPILAYKGSFFPVPADLSKSISYVGLWYTLGTLVATAAWFTYLWLRRGAQLDEAGSHASIAEGLAAPYQQPIMAGPEATIDSKG